MSIDLIQYRDYLLLVHKNGLAWAEVSEKARAKSLYDLASYYLPPAEIDRNLCDHFDVAADPYRFCVTHYAKHYERFVICDIGAHYGATTMDTIRIAQRAGGVFRAFAFDPGIAGQLAWRNFENNCFDVTFMDVAVGPVDGHFMMFADPGETENNRLVTGRGSECFPVRCVRLDTVLKSKDAMWPACVKIDVQGAEPGVIDGMRALLSSQPVTIQMEMTPWAIRESGLDPVVFIDELMKTHHVFDIGDSRQHMNEVHLAADAVKRIDSGAPYWSDILVVPKHLKVIEGLLTRLRAAAG